jgi:hypothetical protein
MSISPVSGLSNAAHRAVDRTHIPDTKVARAIAVLIVLGFSAAAGLFALVTLLSALGGDLSAALLSAVTTAALGTPAILAWAWLDKSGADQLV